MYVRKSYLLLIENDQVYSFNPQKIFRSILMYSHIRVWSLHTIQEKIKLVIVLNSQRNQRIENWLFAYLCEFFHIFSSCEEGSGCKTGEQQVPNFHCGCLYGSSCCEVSTPTNWIQDVIRIRYILLKCATIINASIRYSILSHMTECHLSGPKNEYDDHPQHWIFAWAVLQYF